MSEHFISRAEAESDLLSCAAYLSERITSIDGHADALSAVIPQYLAKGNVDLAAELANTVDDPFTRDKLLTLVAERCAQMDDEDYAMQLADAVEEPGIRAQAFERVAIARVEKGHLEAAREIAASVADPDPILTAIAVKQNALSSSEEAQKTIDEIEHAGAAVAAYLDMAAHQLATSDADGAIRFLDLAVEEAADIEHKEEQARVYCDIGHAFIEAGRNDRAIETYDKAKGVAETIGNMHRDVLLSYASLGFLHAGSLELADRALDLVEDKTQIASTLLGYARELWRKEERTEAIDSLEEAYAILESQHERETRDSRSKFRLYTQIASQFAGFEKGERAVGIAEKIKDPGERTAALSQVAAILTIRKEDDEARHAYRAIAEDSDRVFALIGMSDAKEKNEDHEAAVQMLKEAGELADTVPQLTVRASAASEIGRRLSNHGEAADAEAAFRHSLESILQIRDKSSQAVALAALAQVVASAGVDVAIPTQALQNLAASATR